MTIYISMNLSTNALDRDTATIRMKIRSSKWKYPSHG